MRSLLLTMCMLAVPLGSVVEVSRAEEVELLSDSDFTARIAVWESPSFSKRNAASIQLRDAGSAAFPALAKAAEGGSREVIARALAILQSSLKSPGQSAAARQTLEQLAAGQDSQAARSARQVLQDHDRPPTISRTNALRAQFGQQQFGQQQFGQQRFGQQRFGVPQNAPNFPQNIIVRQGNLPRRTSIRAVNGRIILEVTDNESKIKIETDPAGQIKIETTKKKLGVDVTEQFEARNAAELKTKHPEAHRIFQQYELTLKSFAERRVRPGVGF